MVSQFPRGGRHGRFVSHGCRSHERPAFTADARRPLQYSFRSCALPHSMSTPPSSAPRAPMLSTADALATLLGAALAVDGTETLPTLDARNRVLAADVVSPLDVPPMNTSSMDGYAVRSADLSHRDRRLPVPQRFLSR